MDKEFLSDYAAKEREEQERLAKLSDIGAAKERYKKRYRLISPVARNAEFESLWPQIPMYGTVVISLAPMSSGFFSLQHGFDILSIDRLVDFARDTGKVAFVLDEDPEEYCGLDFLDPIFIELKPPGRYSVDITNWQLYRDCAIEFDTLSRVKLYRLLASLAHEAMIDGAFGTASRPEKASQWLAHVFATLGVLGYDELKQSISDALVNQPSDAFHLLCLLDKLIVGPRTDPLDAIWIVSSGELQDPRGASVLSADARLLETLKHARSQIHTPEIGKFLMTKLAPYPEGLEACKVLCEKYSHYDLYEVMNSLDCAIRTEDRLGLDASAKKVSETLDRIWHDADKFGTGTTSIRLGLSIALAAIGTAATGPTPAGVLAGLGYSVVDKILELKTDSISERIAKWLTPNYLVSVFDFKKMYGLKETLDRVTRR